MPADGATVAVIVTEAPYTEEPGELSVVVVVTAEAVAARWIVCSVPVTPPESSESTTDPVTAPAWAGAKSTA